MPKIGILGHNGNDRPALSHYHSFNGDNRYTGTLVIVNALDIDSMHHLLDNMHIITCNAIIGTMVNKRCWWCAMAWRGYTVDVSHVDCMIVSLTMYNDLCWCRSGSSIGYPLLVLDSTLWRSPAGRSAPWGCVQVFCCLVALANRVVSGLSQLSVSSRVSSGTISGSSSSIAISWT